MDAEEENIITNNGPTFDDDCLFHNLPNLVLTKIFKKLETLDRMIAMSVCSRWDYVMNDAVGIIKYVGKEALFSYPNLLDSIKWAPLDAMESCGICRCIFGDISFSLLSSQTLPVFYNPHIVTNVGFYGEISQPYFIQLTSPLIFLQSLTLHLAVFINVNLKPGEMVNQNLKSLQLVYTHCLKNIGTHFTNEQEETVHKNLLNFLKITFFKKIQSLSLRFPYFRTKMDELFESIMNFCKKHQYSIDELNINIPYEWSKANSTIVTTSPMRQFDWGKLQLRKVFVIPGLDITEQAGNNALAEQLRKQSMNTYWTSLLLNQKKLARLHYENPDYETWGFPVSLFRDNAATLTCALLTVNPLVTVDCIAFEKCHYLRRLNLHGTKSETLKNLGLMNQVDASVPRFINAVKLPITLEELDISRILIATTELEDIFKIGHLPSLKYLSLLKISASNLTTCGMTLKLVNQILKTSGVQTITLISAFNTDNIKQAFQKTQSNTSYEEDEELAVLNLMLELLEKYGHDYNYFKLKPEEISLEYYRLL